MTNQQQTDNDDKSSKKLYSFLFWGSFSILVSLIIIIFYNFSNISNFWGWILFFFLLGVFVGGLVLWYFATKLLIADAEKVDEGILLKPANDSGLKLKEHYDEYCRTLIPKRTKEKNRKSKNGQNTKMGHKSYDDWYSEIRGKYKTQISEERKKKAKDHSVKGFTPDMKHSLLVIKRKVAFQDDLYKTVILPAELGLIAIICTAGVFVDVRIFILAFLLTFFICFIYTKMLIVNRKIDNFIDDFVDAVEIDLDDIHNMEEPLD